MTDRLHELLVCTALRAATPRLHLIFLAAASSPSSQTSAAHGICLEASRITDPVAYFMSRICLCRPGPILPHRFIPTQATQPC